MKTIGLMGGIGWASTAAYYRMLNEGANRRRGGVSTVPLLIHSFDYGEIAALQDEGEWDEIAARLIAAARLLEQGGADVLAMACNTTHKFADAVADAVAIPLVNLIDATADAIAARGIQTVGLTGTLPTMREKFYVDRLAQRRGLRTILPNAGAQAALLNLIHNELVRGIVSDAGRATLRRICEELMSAGAGGVILGCTELGLVLDAETEQYPVFDTTAIHVTAILDSVLGADGAEL